MNGNATTLTLPLAPAVGAPGPQFSPGHFHSLVWGNWLRPWVRNRLTRAAYQQVLSGYLDPRAAEGMRDGSWRATETQLEFVFGSDGDERLAVLAARHWVELALAEFASSPSWIAWARDCGYAVQPSSGIEALLARGASPGFIELRKVLHAVPRLQSDDEAAVPALFTVRGTKCTPYSELPKGTQQRVLKVARDGVCACELCDRVRAERAKLAAKAPAR